VIGDGNRQMKKLDIHSFGRRSPTFQKQKDACPFLVFTKYWCVGETIPVHIKLVLYAKKRIESAYHCIIG
jgi:hypothetical protein